jgi:hypothetical protein
MKIARLFTALLGATTALSLVVAVAQPTQASTRNVPPLVLRASAAFATQMHGVVAMQRHFTTEVRAGPVMHGEQSDSGQLMQDGHFVKIAYYRIVRDGQIFSASQIQQRNDETNRDWAAGKVFFKEPYDPQFMNDYSFGQGQFGCPCPAGTEAVSFASTSHDSQHGSGMMYIGTSNAHVVKLTYTAYILPPHASSGSVTETSGQALPDLWYVLRIDETYRGHEFLISGTGTFTGVFDHFRRFQSLSSGEAALHAQTI